MGMLCRRCVNRKVLDREPLTREDRIQTSHVYGSWKEGRRKRRRGQFKALYVENLSFNWFIKSCQRTKRCDGYGGKNSPVRYMFLHVSCLLRFVLLMPLKHRFQCPALCPCKRVRKCLRCKAREDQRGAKHTSSSAQRPTDFVVAGLEDSIYK